MNPTYSHIYLAQKQPWYSTQPLPIVKIGKANVVSARQAQLSRTNEPMDTVMVAAWQVPHQQVLDVESRLHRMLDKYRLVKNGKTTEWFSSRQHVSTMVTEMMEWLGYSSVPVPNATKPTPQLPQMTSTLKASLQQYALGNHLTLTQKKYYDFWTNHFVHPFPPHITPAPTNSKDTLCRNYRECAYKGHQWSYTLKHGDGTSSVGLYHPDKTRNPTILRLESEPVRTQVRRQLAGAFPNCQIDWRLSNSEKQTVCVRIKFDMSQLDTKQQSQELFNKMVAFSKIIKPHI